MNLNPQKSTLKTLALTSMFLTLLYVLTPSLLSQATSPAKDEPAKTSEVSKDAKDATTVAPASTEAPAPAPAKKSPGLIDLFFAGGWSMWPLALSSIIGFGVAFERIYFFFTTKLVAKGYNQELEDKIEEKGLDGALGYIKDTSDQKISYILKNGYDVANNDPEVFTAGVEREAGEVITLLERGLTILASVSTIAPLIGFLGTVSGMINAFDAIANADQVNAKVVAGGIKEALITTAAGLIVAIPVMSFYQYLSGRVNGFATDVEEAANKVYKELLRKKGTLGK
jgi:biopolymer transport protein ExbB